MMDAVHRNDLTRLEGYKTPLGKKVFRWLNEQEWIGQKADRKREEKIIMGSTASMGYFISDGNVRERVILKSKREFLEFRWKFDNVYLVNLKGVEFNMLLSEFVLDRAAADAKLARQNQRDTTTVLIAEPSDKK